MAETCTWHARGHSLFVHFGNQVPCRTMVATDYRTLTKDEEDSSDMPCLAGEALLDLTPETHDQKKVAHTRLSDANIVADDTAGTTLNDDKSEQHSDSDLDKEIDRALAEIRQDASLTGEECESSAGSSTERSLRNGFDNNHTSSTVEADNSVTEADGGEITDMVEMCKEVTIMDALRYLEKQEKLIRVMFTPSVACLNPENVSFLVSVSLVAQREQEMLAMASANGIDESDWSGSLLGRKCLALIGDIALQAAGYDDDYFSCASNDEDVVEDATSTEENTYTFVLDGPSSSGTDLVWTPSLVDAIRSYYTLGSVSVSDDCDGRDILLILNHFGVVYRTEQLVHQSFGVHLRVKLWSEYFAARGQLAEWVTKTIMNGRSKLSYSFVTSPDTDDGPIFVAGTKKTEVFEGGLLEDGANKSAMIVHDLFVDESPLTGDSDDATDRIDALIRRDFCTHLLERLPGCSISFDLCTVCVGGPLRESEANVGNTPNLIRAVLQLDFSGRSIQKETSKALVKKVSEAAACQTAIQTLDNDVDEENEDQIHPNLATAPTVVDLDEEETLDVHLKQVNSGDDCDNKSTVSTLSSSGDGGSLLAAVVEADEAARHSVPLPPPPPESVNINAPVLDYPPSEECEILQVAKDPPSRKAEGDCTTIEDLNSQWLLDFINRFTTFVEETLQACDSNSSANVESVLWPSLFSMPEVSSRPDSLYYNEPLQTRDATVDSVFPPAKREARPYSQVKEKKMPKEAGIEVRPLKSRSADARPPISNSFNAPTPLARNRLSSVPAAISASDVASRADSKQGTSVGASTKTMRRAKSIKTVFSKKKSKKFYT